MPKSPDSSAAGDEEARSRNRGAWDDVAGSGQGRTALPDYGPLCESEEELNLLGEIANRKVLELGCGDGQSLVYLHRRGCAELAGIDISEAQIAIARENLAAAKAEAELRVSPMEQGTSLPLEHYDLVLSLYALGWTLDLEATLRLAYSHLAHGGRLIYSWEHPLFSCMSASETKGRLGRPYQARDEPFERSWRGKTVSMVRRSMSAYINATASAGFVIERLMESELRPYRSHQNYPKRWYSQERAQWAPTTFIVLARKA